MSVDRVVSQLRRMAEMEPIPKETITARDLEHELPCAQTGVHCKY